MLTVSINTLYWPNSDTKIVKAHCEVMEHLGLEVNYTVDQRDHGQWMDAVMEHIDADIICFLDIDCVPTNRKVFDDAVEWVDKHTSFLGIAQVSNHIKPCSHIYAAPAFLMVHKDVWQHLHKPTFKALPWGDVAENFSYSAEMAGVKYKTLMPTHYYKRPEGERWFLHSYGEYGIGTHFEGGIFHLYQGRLPQNQLLFKRVCRDIIKGTFTTDKMKDSREI
jgi:hypothetical protein